MKRMIGGMLLLLLIVGCTGSGQPSPSPTPTPTPTPSPSPSPTPAAGIYLRAWQTQALPPPSTFLTGPLVTISDGLWIDNNVAIPLIFPGPLLILPNGRTISAAGQQAIVDQMRDLGLLEGETDFTGGGVPPGGITAHLLLIVDGTTYELIGNPDKVRFCDNQLCPVDPGTPEAFAAFWSALQDTSKLEQHLGPNGQYQPERLAVLVVPPVEDNSGIVPNKVAWPITTGLDEFGDPYAGGEGMRCAVVEGDDLAALLPALLAGNQLTVFFDDDDLERSVNVRALVPGEESPC